MVFTAKAKYVRLSPYKLRPLADVVRGKSAVYVGGADVGVLLTHTLTLSR